MRAARRIGKPIFALIRAWRRLGTPTVLRWLPMRLGQKLRIPGPASWRAHPCQLEHDLIVRSRGTSDMDVFSHIYIHEEYLPLRCLENISLVLDLGANVGYSSAYFLSCFQDAHVISVEPDDRNIEVCRANLKPYGDRVLVLHGAVWSRCTKLCLSHDTFGDGREWATQVVRPDEASAGYVQAWDVGSLIALGSAEMVDLLKVDIERAELEVFGETAIAWLPRVRNICIELHGADCEKAFFNALAGFDYELGHSSGLTVCKNIRPKVAAD